MIRIKLELLLGNINVLKFFRNKINIKLKSFKFHYCGGFMSGQFIGLLSWWTDAEDVSASWTAEKT